MKAKFALDLWGIRQPNKTISGKKTLMLPYNGEHKLHTRQSDMEQYETM